MIIIFNRHLLLNCGDHFDAIGPELWVVAVSSLSLMVRCNLSIVQQLIGEGFVMDGVSAHQLHPLRLEHLSRQIFNLSANDPLPQASHSGNLLTALLSYQLAVNTIANVVCCNNTLAIG